MIDFESWCGASAGGRALLVVGAVVALHPRVRVVRSLEGLGDHRPGGQVGLVPARRVPEPRAQERLGAVVEDLLDLDNLARGPAGDPSRSCRRRTAASRTRSGAAVDAQRVRRRSGHEIDRPTCGLATMLWKPSARRLPGRSGIAIVVSSRTRVKPGGSPFGDTSQVPSAPAVATRQNGEAASQARSCSCRLGRSLPGDTRGRLPDQRAQLLGGTDLGPGGGLHVVRLLQVAWCP